MIENGNDTNIHVVYINQLKNLSKDITNNRIVCSCENFFIDFDKQKKERKTSKEPSSPDMLLISDYRKEILFVEFKSSNYESLEGKKYELWQKVLEGLIIFYEIFQGYFNYKKLFFLVYKKEISHEDFVVESIGENRPIEFGLEEFKGKFLEDVFTEDCETFKEFLKSRYSIELECL